MKRVLLFTENLGSGGAERQLSGLAVMLKRRGYVVKVLTYLDVRFYEHYLNDNGVEHELNERIMNGVSGLLSLYQSVTAFRPDTVISFLPAPNRRMCLVRLLCRFNLIVSERSHTLYWNKRAKVKFSLYALADRVVTNSFSEYENVTTHCHWLKSKSFAIPNYVDVDRFVPAERQQGEMARLLSVGRLIANKNVIQLLEAMSELWQRGFRLCLTWVGAQYDKGYLSEVQNRISELGLEGKVVLKDQTDDVLAEYQAADVFCFPTLLEGYPNVLVEAMSCGLPVVCSNVCEMPKIVEEGVNGFMFNPLDVGDMVSAIERMLRLSYDEWRKIGRRNRQKVIDDNSESAFVGRYISIL